MHADTSSRAMEYIRPMKDWAQRNIYLLLALAGGNLLFWILLPELFVSVWIFTFVHMVFMMPLVSVGLLFSGWVNASGAAAHIQKVCNENTYKSIMLSSALGAVSPICGFCVIPLMASLLIARVPLAPVLAYWLSSPLIDPTMFAATTAVLGFEFAAGKAVSSFAMGMIGGTAVLMLGKHSWIDNPLREDVTTKFLKLDRTKTEFTFKGMFWKEKERLDRFKLDIWVMARLVFICMLLAYFAEGILDQVISEQFLAGILGDDAWWSIPLAALIGSPLALDGYIVLPLTRGFIDFGMSMSAAMAFVVSSGVVSVLGILAVFPVLKNKPLFLYTMVAVGGSVLAGWGYSIFTAI